MEDAQNHFDFEVDAMGENIQVGNVEMRCNGRRNQGTPLYIV
jgi:hypothetical protein